MEWRGKTIKDTIAFEGVGIHTGEIAKIKVHPSDKKGIFFYKNGLKIPAHHKFVVNTLASTDLGLNGVSIRTVEHLMAAFYLLGIDSAVVEVEKGSEIPIADGGSKTFVEAFKEVGLVELPHRQTIFTIKEYFRIQPNGNYVEVEPYEGELFTFEGIFPKVGRRSATYRGEIEEALIGARTFCDVEDVVHLWLCSFGLGGYAVNTLPLTENLEFLVYSSEPAYHKLLDLIGDLALLGGRVVGKIYSFKGNHRLNHQLRDYILKSEKVKKLNLQLKEFSQA